MAVVTDDGEDAIEWWTVLVLRTEGDQRIHFIERRTAETYARFLIEDDTPLVILERWREAGRVDVELIEALPER